MNVLIQNNFFRLIDVCKKKNPFSRDNPEALAGDKNIPALHDDIVTHIVNHFDILEWLDTPIINKYFGLTKDLSLAQECEAGLAGVTNSVQDFLRTSEENCSIQ